MLEIVEVKTRKQIKDFLNLPLKMYKGVEPFVPPLYSDELKMFKKNYMYYDQSESKFWVAYKDGKCVGRIQAILQKASNAKWNQKRMRFSRVDFIDDIEVSKALFDKVEEYAKEKGMSEVVGPLGFSDLEREGMLIKDFESMNTFEEQYNFPYYMEHMEKLGYGKDVDWIEHRLFVNDEKSKKVLDLKEKILAKGKIHMVPKMPLKKFAKLYEKQFFDILDATYDSLYGTVPFTQGMKDLLIKNYRPIINMDYLKAVVDENDKIVAFAIAFPAMDKIFKKSNGHLYPQTIVKLLYNVHHPYAIDLGLVGVAPEGYLNGAAIVIYGALIEQLRKDKAAYCETNLNLEDNTNIVETWKHFDAIQHKKRRSWVKDITR